MPEIAFTDRQRRTLAQLGIPRNVDEVVHELRIDPFSPSLSADDLSDHLAEFQNNGWVVNLGENPDPAKLAASLESHGTARVMPDDQAEIYATRLSQPRHEWRTKGDLWVITNDGVERLHEPTVDSPPLEPHQVQAVVDREWARTLKDLHSDTVQDSGDLQLGNKLLADEFLTWFDQVAAETKRVWNVDIRPPMAGGAGWSDVYENRILDHENQKTAMPALVAPWHMALTILAFTDTDTPTTAEDGSHKPTYTGYARKTVAAADMNAASAGSASNANAIIFAACTGGSSTILGFGNFENIGATGDFRKYGTCSSVTVSTTQTPAQFAAGAYTTTAD